MWRSNALKPPAIALTLILTLVGCETLQLFPAAPDPIELLRPSTFCAIYKPVRAPGERGSAEWSEFWDQLQERYSDQYDTIRKNNAAWIANCDV